jgi:hypothetical protein
MEHRISKGRLAPYAIQFFLHILQKFHSGRSNSPMLSGCKPYQEVDDETSP